MGLRAAAFVGGQVAEQNADARYAEGDGNGKAAGTAVKVPLPIMGDHDGANHRVLAAEPEGYRPQCRSPPPMAEVVPASMINWPRISRRLAPRDFRIPISLVRSVTDTIIMFITPIPPTSREMAAIATRTTIMVLRMVFMAVHQLLRRS